MGYRRRAGRLRMRLMHISSEFYRGRDDVRAARDQNAPAE